MKKIKGLLYCCKEKPYLVERLPFNEKKFYQCRKKNDYYSLNGKIVAECDFEVEEIYYLSWMNEKLRERILKQSCLTDKQFSDYMGNKDTCYALHISNLKIFDEPRELSDFNKIIETTYGEEPDATITRAPQNMMRCCYEKKPKEWETGVLISIKPERLCKILNGEKTIECRKRILKEMMSK